MRHRITCYLLFLLERWVQRGMLHQLMLMAGLIVGVAVAGGVLGWILTTQFQGAGPAIWWAFLRLTDPGYLGDDEGLVLRTVSTVVTVLGYVLFMGSLIAIMTQWLLRTIRRLESGVTPIVMRHHVVILGWTNRTPEIIRKVVGARGRLQRFLAAHDASRLRIVVLADDVGPELRQELIDALHDDRVARHVLLRSGSSLQQSHLERLDILRASVVVVPGADFELGGAEMTDTRVIKTLLTLDGMFRRDAGRSHPKIVAEVFDPNKVMLARTAVSESVEVIPSEQIISRLTFQAIRSHLVARILLDIVSGAASSSIYVRSLPDATGRTLNQLIDAVPESIILGVMARGGDGTAESAVFDVRLDRPVQEGELLVFLAERFDRCHIVAGATTDVSGGQATRPDRSDDARPRRILILGWSTKIPSLLAELAADRTGCHEVTIMSKVTIAEREVKLGVVTLPPEDISISQVEGDYSVEVNLRAVEPESFDDVLFLASGWMNSSTEADARTVLGYVLLRSILKRVPSPPRVLVELLDPDNAHLFDDRANSVLLSPRILSHLIANVALRPELNQVFNTLVGAVGAEFALYKAADFDLTGRAVGFREVQHAVAACGVTAVGWIAAGDVALNPGRHELIELAAADEVIVLEPGTTVSAPRAEG